MIPIWYEKNNEKSILEGLGGLLETSWGVLEASEGVLEASWGILGPSWSVLEVSWKHLEASWAPKSPRVRAESAESAGGGGYAEAPP